MRSTRRGTYAHIRLSPDIAGRRAHTATCTLSLAPTCTLSLAGRHARRRPRPRIAAGRRPLELGVLGGRAGFVAVGGIGGGRRGLGGSGRVGVGRGVFAVGGGWFGGGGLHAGDDADRGAGGVPAAAAG